MQFLSIDTTTNDRDRAILLTCLNFTEYNEGDLLQLDDGRIIQLVEFSNGRFIWAHYCFDGNNWGVTEANLACQSLGFDRVKENGEKIQIRDKRVYGLTEIDCNVAESFNNCTSVPRARSDNGLIENERDGRCGMGNSVIATILV